MRRALCLMLSISLLLSSVSSAFAAYDPGGSTVSSQYFIELEETMAQSFGYTDEAITVSTFASSIGVQPREAAALGALVDGWTMGDGIDRFTAAQWANLAAGAHQYMVRNNQWDSFSDHVLGLAEIGGGIMFDASPWYDALGFATLAEARSFGSITDSQGLLMASGLLDGYATPPGFNFQALPTSPGSRIDPAHADHAHAVAVWRGVHHDRGFVIKYGPNPAIGFGGSWLQLWTSLNVFPRLYCAFPGCGWVSSSMSFFSISQWHNDGTVAGWNSRWDAATAHYKTHLHEITSEAAAIMQALIDPDVSLPHKYLLSRNMLSNPGGTLFAAGDAWGIPGVMEPGEIHDRLKFASGWGDGLSAKADELAAKVHTLPVGFAELVDAFASVLDWLGGLLDALQDWTVRMVVPNPDWLDADWRPRFEAVTERFETRFPFSILSWVRSQIATFESQGG